MSPRSHDTYIDRTPVGRLRDVDGAFGLLAYYGAESAGSVTLLPDGAPLPDSGELRCLRALRFIVIEDMARQLG